MITVVATVLALSMTASLIAAWIAYLEFNRQSELRRRVDFLLLGRAAAMPGTNGRVKRLLARLARQIRSVFTVGFSRTWGMTATLKSLLPIGVVGGLLIFGLMRLALHLPILIGAAAGFGAFLIVPRFLLGREQHKADAQFTELLPDAIDMVVRMVRAGLPVSAAIRAVGGEADMPVSRIFGNVADLSEIGMPLSEALSRISAEVANSDFRFFSMTVALQQSTGGNLAATLETLSEIIRKRRAVRLKAHAATAEIRISAIVLAAIPFFIVGALFIVSPGYLEPLISDRRGNIIAGASILSLALAGITMRAMMRAAVKA